MTKMEQLQKNLGEEAAIVAVVFFSMMLLASSIAFSVWLGNPLPTLFPVGLLGWIVVSNLKDKKEEKL